MIYLITGVPGSGKTLLALAKLVRELVAAMVKANDGVEHERRLCVDGIPELIIPHELMAPVVEDDKGNLSSEGDSLLNWWTWCKPGDVLLVDEVQRYWRPRGMGTKPPDMIKHLETHRHLGVDFVIITQNPMLIDQNVRRLVGRHIHVRRLFGLNRCITYDWDGCSVDVHRTKSATMGYWSYDKEAFKLYKSSELHTKQKQKVPPWLIVPVLALVGGIAVAPMAFSTMRGAMTGKGVGSSSATGKPLPDAQAASASKPAASASAQPVAQASPPAPGASASKAPEFAGCAWLPPHCRCYDTAGQLVEREPAACQREARPIDAPGLAGGVFVEPAQPVEPRPQDGIAIAGMRNGSRRW